MFPPESLQQRKNFRLYGGIQRTGGLIRNEQRRPADERLRNRNPLLLSPAELVRIRSIDALYLIESDLFQNRFCTFPALARRPVFMMSGGHVGNLRPNPQGRVQGTAGILKDERDLCPA